MKPHGNAVVQAWLDRQTAETLYVTATSFSELLVGIEILPDGKRKEGLAAALSSLMVNLFASRILPFDQAAAMAYAPLIGCARASGCLIVSDCRSHLARRARWLRQSLTVNLHHAE